LLPPLRSHTSDEHVVHTAVADTAATRIGAATALQSLVSASSVALGSIVEQYVATTVHSQLASALRSLQGDTIEKPHRIVVLAPASRP